MFQYINIEKYFTECKHSYNRTKIKDMIEISIITVVYNDCKGFKKTAKSVISQTAMHNIQWIVIDAASTDGTTDIIRELNPYINYWSSEPDKGIYDGMNKGIAQAKGQYILFLNAGDTLYNEFTTETLIKSSAFGHTDYISGNTVYINEGQAIGVNKAPKKITGRFLFKESLCHPSTLIRTDRIKKNGGYDTSYRIAADAKFFFQDIVINNASYQNIDECISRFDMTGISSTQHEKTYHERLRFLQELLPPKVYKDYHRTVYGKTKLERVLCKLKENNFRYKTLTAFALLLYSPTAIWNRAIMKYRKLRNNKK